MNLKLFISSRKRLFFFEALASLFDWSNLCRVRLRINWNRERMASYDVKFFRLFFFVVVARNIFLLRESSRVGDEKIKASSSRRVFLFSFWYDGTTSWFNRAYVCWRHEGFSPRERVFSGFLSIRFFDNSTRVSSTKLKIQTRHYQQGTSFWLFFEHEAEGKMELFIRNVKRGFLG